MFHVKHRKDKTMDSKETREALLILISSLTPEPSLGRDTLIRDVKVDNVAYVLEHAIKNLKEDKTQDMLVGTGMSVKCVYVSGYEMILKDVDSVHTTADRIVIVHKDGEVNTLMKENVAYFTLGIQ